MDELIEALQNLIEGNWTKLASGLAMMLLGWWIGKRRALSAWKKKEFLDRLNVSLNSIHEGKLLIRTVLEKSCQEIFLNTVAVDAVLEASRQTTASDSTLPLPKDEYWYYLNSVLNEIAEKFALGAVKRDLGQSVQVASYVICLTCESAGELKTRKVRAMLVQKKLLDQLPAECPKLESPHHTTRWETLKQLAAERTKSPHKFLEIEIAI